MIRLTRPLTVFQRAICLVLTALLALVLGTGVVSAQQPGVSQPDTSNAPESLQPSSDYSVDLNAQIAAFTQRVATWQQRAQPLMAQAQSLIARIDAHNARVNSFPNRRAPAAVANAVNAEATALNAERDQLRAQVAAWSSEGQVLETERMRLLRQAAHILQNQYKVRPPVVQRAPGGDPSRQLGRNNRGEYTRDNGGDSVSRKREQAALDAYAKDHNVTVDRRQVAARLSPETLDKLSPAQVAKLKNFRKFDGLIRKPDGRYKALEVKTAGTGLRPGQAPFDNAILRGGHATAVVDGKVIIIDEVEIVPG
jgi:hypothetical protein